MWVLETVVVAFSMYSALPVPQLEWNERNMRFALAAFPLVGAALGLAWWGICVLCASLGLPALLRGALLCVLPALATGGIHLDGYADTADALASHAPPERRREILRDPHCGAFAMIRLCVYYIVYFALCCVVEPTPAAIQCMGFGFVLSRALSGAALTVLPLSEGSSLARTFADAADKKLVRALLGAVSGACLAGLYLSGGRTAFLASLAVLLVAALHYGRVARRGFGGTSGDLAGWFLVKEEFWLLAALAAAQYAERVL